MLESRHLGAFNEDDQQIAENFGRYVAIALNILDLMVGERVITSHKVADEFCSEVAGPLNDINSDIKLLMDEEMSPEERRAKLQQVMENVCCIQDRLHHAATPNANILGAGDVKKGRGSGDQRGADSGGG